MRKLRMVVMVVLVLVVFGGVSEAGLRDKFKKVGEAAERTKEKWKASERRCDICNKVVHGRSRCTSCQAKRISDGVKKTSGKVKRTYNSLEHPCSVCGVKTRLKGRCSRCLSKSVQAGGRKAVQFGREAAARSKRVAEKSKEMYGKARQQYGRILDRTKDPEVRRKMTEAIGTVLEVRARIKEAKRAGTYKGFDALASIPVGDGKTFGDIAAERLLEKYPSLVGTGLCDDPAETATAIILHDSKFFLGKVKILKKDGKNFSVLGAIKESSPFNAAQTIKYLKIAEATGDVAYSLETGEDVGEAVGSVFGAIESVNKK